MFYYKNVPEQTEKTCTANPLNLVRPKIENNTIKSSIKPNSTLSEVIKGLVITNIR